MHRIQMLVDADITVEGSIKILGVGIPDEGAYAICRAYFGVVGYDLVAALQRVDEIACCAWAVDVSSDVLR